MNKEEKNTECLKGLISLMVGFDRNLGTPIHSTHLSFIIQNSTFSKEDIKRFKDLKGFNYDSLYDFDFYELEGIDRNKKNPFGNIE